MSISTGIVYIKDIKLNSTSFICILLNALYDNGNKMHFIINSDYQSPGQSDRVVILLTSKSRGDMEESIMGLDVVVVSELSVYKMHQKC